MARGILLLPALAARLLLLPALLIVKVRGQDLPAEDRQRVCDFFAQGDSERPEQHTWGQHVDDGTHSYKDDRHGLCTRSTTLEMFKMAESVCESCFDGTDVCRNPPQLIFHQYLNKLHGSNWKANLLCHKSYLLTQNLSTTRFYMWVDSYGSLLENPEVRSFFAAFKKHIILRRVKWQHLVKGTPFEGHPFFSDEERLKRLLPVAPYGDLLRLLVTHKYGGVWVDNDVIMLRDWRPLLVNVGYQFAMRWINGHVLYVRRQSELSQRLLQFSATMPYDAPDIDQKIKDVCDPIGYFPASPGEYGNSDLYNGCTLRAGLMLNNTGPPPGNKMYDYPLGWFDPIWASPPEWGRGGTSGSCLDIRKNLPRKEWVESEGLKYHAFHTRWPKVPSNIHPLGLKSPLGRCIDTLDTFFDTCKSLDCLPRKASFLVEYDSTS